MEVLTLQPLDSGGWVAFNLTGKSQLVILQNCGGLWEVLMELQFCKKEGTEQIAERKYDNK